MKTNRLAYVLSVLLVLVLVCGIVPAAYADNSCICTSAQNKNPACTCGCNGDMKSMREEALQQFLMFTIAAEAETDIRKQAALYRQAAELWEAYMDIVLSNFGPAYAAGNEMLPPESYGVIGAMDGPTDIYLPNGPEEEYLPYPYYQDAPEEVFAAYPDMRSASFGVPDMPESDEDRLPPEDEILEEFMMYMFMAREETDPAVREQLYMEAGELWDTYMYLMFGDADKYGRDAYGPDMPMEGQRPDQPQPQLGGPGQFGPRGNEFAPAPEQPVPGYPMPEQPAPEQPAPDENAQDDPYLDNQDAYNMLMAGILREAMTESVVDRLSEGIIGQSAAAMTAPETAPADPYLNTETEDASALYNQALAGALRESITDSLVDILTEGIINESVPTGIGMPNPWTKTDSLEEAIKISGVDVTLPAAEDLPHNMKLMFYRAVPGTLEADYGNEEEKLMFRASVDDEGYNLSGDYNTYSHAWQAIVGEHLVDCLGDGKNMNIALFRDGNTAYAITMNCGKEGAGLTADEMAAFVLDVLPTAEQEPAAEQEPVSEQEPAAEQEPVSEQEPANTDNGEIIILFTGNVRCGIDEGIGYAGVKSIRDSLKEQGYTTILVDGGNAVQGGEIGSASQGEAIIDLMNAVGYDVAVPGDHEIDYGDEQFLALVKRADFPYISSNFTVADELALEPYVIVEASGKRIAFVGVNVAGNDEKSAEALQNAVNDARNNGAEIVYVIGNMTEGANAEQIVANTTGIDVFLDNNGGEAVVLNDKANETVLYVSCGERLSKVGYSRINAAGAIVETGAFVLPEGEAAVIDNEITDMVEAAKEKLAAMQSEDAAVGQTAPAAENSAPAEPVPVPAAEPAVEPAAEDDAAVWDLSDEELAQLRMIVDYLYALRQAK